ncbi:hypothetical protein J3E72DRAFT_278899 [Bipolaris maydis]|nr:hypothetical protein J3E72DRAFT_278899 [Bipolaris maydis]
MRVLSFDPLLIHLEGFITDSERTHLLRLGEHRYNSSKINLPNGTKIISQRRTSDTARLPTDDPIVQRIVTRASTLQGYTPEVNIETLQLTKYNPGQYYMAHWDHYQDVPVPENESQRMTTIFAILDADCDECGTQFPNLSVDWSKEDSRWCEFVDCNNTGGITVRPIPGNALFWKNIDASSNGVRETLHAGLPPLNGTKIGLNIWTREKKWEQSTLL